MSSSSHKFLTHFILGAICLSCQPSQDDLLFRDLTADITGLHFKNQLAYSENFNIVDYLYYYDGGGVAVGDINNDGLSDIYFVSNEGDNGLFLNLGNMKFQDITSSAGVKSSGLWKNGVSMADVNGDGLLDIYLCRLGKYKDVSGKNELYINRGDLTFIEEAEKYNLDFVGFSTQAAFFDMDNDGDLDVYLLNHSVHSDRSFGNSRLRMDIDTLAGDRIYRNDNNYFIDISSQSGIYRSQIGYGLGIGLSDINKDGFTDIFISNDFTENDYLYLNNQDGSFTDLLPEMADNSSLSSMGNDLADFNNDGNVDILTLDMLPADEIIRKSTVGDDSDEIFRMKLLYGYMPQYKRNTLQLNHGNGTFSDIGMLAGIHATDWSWSSLFADFDNDGWKDIFISNGIPGRPNDLDYLAFIESERVANDPDIPDSIIFNTMPEGKIANYFFRNKKDLTYQDISEDWGVEANRITNGIAYSDLDNDGDLDLVLNNLDAPVIIKENTTNKDTTVHYLDLELVGKKKNTKAVGAKVEVYSQLGYQFYELFPTRGFKSSVDPRIHVGLGRIKTVDSVRINWPNGGKTVLHEVKADRMLKLTEPLMPVVHNDSITATLTFTEIPNEELGVDYVHKENTFIEFNREPLLPHMHSREGPALAIGDINGDGFDDFYIGGAKHQKGCIFMQKEGKFVLTDQEALAHDKLIEDVDAGFLDFDTDGDQDLIVISGGNEFHGESHNRQPRLYINDGDGKFTLLPNVFQGIYQTGSCIAVHDYDDDGWQDLFIGSLVVPWNYGISPQSFLLKNDMGRSFIDVSHTLPHDGKLGMINDAEWVDIHGKNIKSLVLAGEWMDITILTPKGAEFEVNRIPKSAGWWKSLHHTDFDGDGDQDLLAGNLGLNSKLKASPKNPLHLYIDDFDRNGKIDAVMTTNTKGEESIFSSRNILVKQIPSIDSKFHTNTDYAKASLNDIFGDGLSQAKKLTVNELRSGIFINHGNGFHFKPFPNHMQVSFIQDFLIEDIDADGLLDIFSVGNLFASSIQEGRYTADRGTLIRGIPYNQQMNRNNNIGISLKGDIRQIESLTNNGKNIIMVVRNNDSIIWLKRE